MADGIGGPGMIDVQCPCGAVSRMAVIAGKFFHFGSQKDTVYKVWNERTHQPICLWCGRKFEPISKALGEGK